MSGRGKAQGFSATLGRGLGERAQPAGNRRPCQGPPWWAMDIAKGFHSSLPQPSHLIKTVYRLFFIRTSPEPLACPCGSAESLSGEGPVCPSGLGLVRRDKDKPLCHPVLVGSHRICSVSGLWFQSHSLLSCQPGRGAVVYFMLFHVFLSLAVTLLWGEFPHWLARLSHLEPWKHVFYPMACAFGVAGDSFPEWPWESTDCIHN